MKLEKPHRGRTYQTKELEQKLIGLKNCFEFDATLYQHLVINESVNFEE